MSKPPIRVLIVDDDVVDRKAVRGALAADGEYEFAVIEADTGADGLRLARAEEPDCLLLDYRLPDLNGLEFLAELADDLGELPLPVIKLTGTDNAAVAVEAMRRGARDYLMKDGERQYLQLLPTVIKRVFQEERTLQEKRQAESNYRSLARHQVSVREEERSRIARDVHDELGQKLTALQLEVAMLSARYHDDPPELREELRSLLALIDSTMDSVRVITADLRPPVLDLGLVPAIEWQVQEFGQRTGIACELALEDDDIELEAERATALFRMLQEALTNVARHARATQVEITLTRDQDRLQLAVADNGVGMPAQQPRGKKTFGLLGLRERALMAGGEVGIDSRPGRTTVRITLPVAGTAMENRPA